MLRKQLKNKSLSFQQAHDLLTAKTESYSKSINHGIPLFRILHVRHPFQRIYSAWSDKFVSCRENTVTQTFYKQFWQYEKSILRFDDKNYSEQEISLIFKRQNNVTIPFRDFVKWLIDNDSNYKANPHWRPMYQLTSPCLVEYDFISHLETIEADFEFVLEKLGISGMFEFPHGNEKASEKRPSVRNKRNTMSLEQGRYDKILKTARLYKKMDLTKEMIYKLYDLYKLDFELFGYDFEYFIANF